MKKKILEFVHKLANNLWYNIFMAVSFGTFAVLDLINYVKADRVSTLIGVVIMSYLFYCYAKYAWSIYQKANTPRQG